MVDDAVTAARRVVRTPDDRRRRRSTACRSRKGSRVRVHPKRRADAQDLFFADQVAGSPPCCSTSTAARTSRVVLEDDPAADLHDWYGRYFYFAPDEIEPLTEREESRP